MIIIENLKKNSKEKMDKAIESLQNELRKVRTGRAHISMLEGIRVNYYGNLTPLTQVASVSCPDPRSFLIAPWEIQLLKEIESSIVKSELGITPINDGKVIRLKVPELTEERRKDFVKNIKKILEEARVAVRLIRRNANEEIKLLQKNKEVSEDDQKRANNDIQKLTDDYISKIDLICENKEKDIMTL